jgi:GABA permease
VLRQRTTPDKLIVRMWFYPVLSIADDRRHRGGARADVPPGGRTPAAPAECARLGGHARAVLHHPLAGRLGRIPSSGAVNGEADRVLVFANQTVAAVELLSELRSIDQTGHAQYFVCVPANPVDTGVARFTGAVWVEEATVEAARKRLEYTLSALGPRAVGRGDIGDFLPMRALEHAVAGFIPDRLVITTHPEEFSPWLHHDVVERARRAYPAIPVTQVIARLSAMTPERWRPVRRRNSGHLQHPIVSCV